MRLALTFGLASVALLAGWSSFAGGCFYPDYTFNAPEPSGPASGSGGAGGATSSTVGGGGSAGSTGGSGGSTSSNGGGGSAPLEDCLDGVDNDDDGTIDCEDPKCIPDYECVADIPVGWGNFGYVGLYRGTSAPPPCPGDLPNEIYSGDAGLDWSPATCVPCGCEEARGQSCDLVTDLDPSKPGIQPIQISNQPCGTPATFLNTLTIPAGWSGSCFHSEGFAGGQSCVGSPCNASITAATTVVSGGSCSEKGGTPVTDTPNFTVHGKACRATVQGKGCATGSVCLPKPKAPFEPRVCVAKSGDEDCPSPFVVKSVLFDDFDDSRDCTGCSCGPVSGGSCDLTIHLYSDPTLNVCNTEVVSVPTGGCADLTGNPAIHGRSYDLSVAPGGGTCSPASVATPTGSVVTTGPTTFCCLP